MNVAARVRTTCAQRECATAFLCVCGVSGVSGARGVRTPESVDLCVWNGVVRGGIGMGMGRDLAI
jgi:hypothetical protein